MNFMKTTDWYQYIIQNYTLKDGLYIDATMGNGNDTLFLCELSGENGHVIAFDIQQIAIDNTTKLLIENNCYEKATLVLDGHQHMDKYAAKESVDVICFNFGYLPGGDHKIATKPETSIEAIKKGLELLKPNAIMSLCLYSGGDTGYEEKIQIINYLNSLSVQDYNIILCQYMNRKKEPPCPVFIFKR